MKPEDAEEYTQALGQVFSGGWRQIALGRKLGVPEALGLSVQDWVKQRLGGYVRLSLTDRQPAVLELQEQGLKQHEIAAVLGVSEPTISRDLSHERPAADPAHKPREKLSHERLPSAHQWAVLEEARERSAHINQHRRTHPEQFAAEEIFSVLTFALNEADKWTPHVPLVAKTPPGQWALMHERLLAITALVRRMCEPAETNTHRAHASPAHERRHAASS
jgi:hypothetical protein